MLVEACVFNLGQIGELSHAVDDAFIEAHPAIPWAEMYGLRNRIVHDYEGVNLMLEWGDHQQGYSRASESVAEPVNHMPAKFD